MRRILYALAATLLPLSSYAEYSPWGYTCSPCCGPYIEEMYLQVGTGYRHDDFNWSIGDPDNCLDLGLPDVLSRLTWKDLGIWTVNLEADILTCGNVLLRARATYGTIFHGHVRDSDFWDVPFCEEEFEFSRSESKANKGQIYDYSGAIGYEYVWWDGAFIILPLAGYSYEAQHLNMFDGEQLINVDPFTGDLGPLGEIHGLHSTYKTRWYGPWIGLDLAWNVNLCLSVYAEYEYHWTQYRGHGHWNLRPDLPHGFSHRAHGKGHMLKGGLEYEFCPGWLIGIDAEYQLWRTYKGTDRTDILVDIVDDDDNLIGQEIIPVFLRLNHVNWRNLNFSLNLGYVF